MQSTTDRPATTQTSAPAQRRWSWRSRTLRGLAYQVLALAVIAAAAWFLIHNTLANMRVRGIQSGFDFLAGAAGFDIGESIIPYESSDPYWKAFAVGVLNTLRVAVIGIVLTTLIGALAGVGRFSRNAIVRAICYGYVEMFRNIPVLLQLIMWYILFTEVLPPISEAIQLAPGVYVSKSGMSFPWPVWEAGHAIALLGAIVGFVIAALYRRRARAIFAATGRPLPTLWPSLAIVLGGALLGWLIGGAPATFDVPVKGEVIVAGGAAMTPEFVSVLVGLVLYTGTFVAEVVRAGIQSVPHGQVEAAAALGLSRLQQMRLVILPQALRVIIPPMTNQYLNLTKNSSLAVAIGYPDIVSISNTAINQTGRAVECIAVIMAVYLALSVATSALMGWYNKRAAIRER
jgi:general L-amino acid transport system permease protein